MDKNEKLIDKDHQDEEVKTNSYIVNVNTRIQHQIKNNKLLSNKICTSKYNFYNAIPKILWEQFSKVGNIYFLFLAILQMIPNISQSGGSPVMLFPLMFVVLVNGVKDFCEDYKRKKSDNMENKTKIEVIHNRPNEKSIVNWEDLCPGDIVKVRKNEYFPADLVLFYSSNKNGVGYVETKNLDGETNLKYKESVKPTYRVLKNFTTDEERENAVRLAFGNIITPMPNANMYEFEGVFNFENRNRSSEAMVDTSKNDLNRSTSILLEHSLTKNEDEIQNENTVVLDYNSLLLRGSSLRNTEFIYGVVIYAGHNSKIMLNSLSARNKQSKVFKIMNSQLKLILLVQVITCLTFSIVYVCNPDPFNGVLLNIEEGFSKGLETFVISFLTWLLTISNIVPISLLVTIEMIKFCQAIFISWDYKMYDKENGRRAIVQSSALNEELGQVHDIFTDKTGTLTKNIMQFKYMVVGDHIYGSEEHANQTEMKAKGITNVDFKDETLFEHWSDTLHKNSANITDFIFALALCHSIIIESVDDQIIYNASSPDELSLVNAAKFFGVEFTQRTDDNYIILKYKEEQCKFKLLNLFEFNSDRKRMSVVIRTEDGVIKIITKGADSVITKRTTSDKDIEQRTLQALEGFGKKGLRTLLLAQRVVSEVEYKQFSSKYYRAITTQNPERKKAKLDLCYEMLENDLKLIGATAIEDCLQDDLSQTLISFRQVGIKIWMLTGDHPFTAVSIAHSCGLIETCYSVGIVSSNKVEDINSKLIQLLDETAPVCVVVTGDCLIKIMDLPGLKLIFHHVIQKAKCVICSRVSPKQKAELVLLAKELNPSKTTLAIGDGANDVNMITSADVGIGIMGNEGQQAARSADYVIGQFSFLRRLMFVHGREAYRKNSYAVGYILWKNFLYCVPIVFFGFSSFFSGQQIYDPVIDTMYNILFTAYPIGWFATYDKEMNYDKLELDPKLYAIGMENSLFNLSVFWRWYVYAVLGGLIMYWNLTYFLIFAVNENNNPYDLYSMGHAAYTCIVFVVNLKIMIGTNTHNGFSIFLLIFSTSSFVLVIFFSSMFFPNMQTFGSWRLLFGSKMFCLSIVLVITSCILLEYGYRSLQFLIEKILIVNKVKELTEISNKKSQLEGAEIEEVDEQMSKKGFSIKINNSINKETEDELVEEKKSELTLDQDQRIVLNRRYTGHAFSEDVANVKVLNRFIKEDFVDEKFRTSEKDLTDTEV